MKLQAIGKMCKAAKRFIIAIGENQAEWISDSVHYYRIAGIWIDKESIADVFALSDKQADKMIILSERKKDAIFARDTLPFGEPVYYEGTVWVYDQKAEAFSCNGEIMYVTEAATKPTCFDSEALTDIRLVYDDDKNPYIAIYRGMFCDALLSPVRPDVAIQISAGLAKMGGMRVFRANEAEGTTESRAK